MEKKKLTQQEKEALYIKAVTGLKEANDNLLKAMQEMRYHPRMAMLKKLHRNTDNNLRAFPFAKRKSFVRKVVKANPEALKADAQARKIEQEAQAEDEEPKTLLADNAKPKPRSRRKKK